MATPTIATLEKSRRGHRLQLGLHESLVENHELNTKVMTVAECEKVLVMLNKMDEKVNKINEMIYPLCADDAETQTSVENANAFAMKWMEVVNRLESIQRTLIAATPTPVPVQNLKLPRMELPTFSGKYEDWQSFQDLFLASVNNNATLSGAQKLHYLKGCVTGEAATLIKSFTVTDTHYTEAWALLTDRYDNSREIVSSLIAKIFNQPSVNQECAESIRRVLDVTSECLRSLKVLNRPVDSWDDLIVFLVLKKLDSETRRWWSRSLSGNNPPTWKELKDFLESHIRGLQASRSTAASSNTQPSSLFRSSSGRGGGENRATNSNESCVYCGQSHIIFKCSSFKALTVEERCNQAKAMSLCSNCLRPGHFAKTCPSTYNCRQCGKKHNSLLHFERKEDKQAAKSNKTAQAMVTTVIPPPPPVSQAFTLLMTAKVKLQDKSGNHHVVRAFVDPGSEATIITEECAKALGLKRTFTKTEIRGAGSSKVGVSKSIINLNVSSLVYEASLDVEALVLPSVTAEMPRLPCDPSSWKHLNGLELADPTFHVPGKIDILLGGEIFASILRPGLKHGEKGSPSAQNTILGWVLSGKVAASINKPIVQVHHTTSNIDKIVEKFWELEELPKKRFFTKEEQECEQHFQSTHYRDGTGRFVVRLPFNDKVNNLGSSREQAFRRLISLEKRFTKYPQSEAEYRKFMDEYEALGHMVKVPADQQYCDKAFYLPHHFVMKNNSTTTKLRVVFDGSAKSSTGVSLNDAMMLGPTIQDDIFTILCRFRGYPIALKGDITKMFRQFGVSKVDQNYQRILWRKSPLESVVEFWLARVTYGTKTSSFLSTRCLVELARIEALNFPIASKALLNDVYVDDLMSGASTTKEAILLFKQICQLLQKGGMEMRKWMTSDPEVLEAIPIEMRDTQETLSLDDNVSVEALGVKWRPSQDSFTFSFTPPSHHKRMTKRMLLSDLAKVFDPLGFLSPVTVQAKMMMQELWKSNIGWDEAINREMQVKWSSYQEQMPLIESLKIPRFFSQCDPKNQELHGFCDASQYSYAAVIYLKTTSHSGNVKVTLIAAKTKVIPVKVVTIPRAELLGAELVTELMCQVREACKLQCDVSLWTDSTVVLDWLNSFPGRWKTFVANRVSNIQKEFPVNCWSHVVSEDNPADCATKGVTPEELLTHDLWWTGPIWLKQSVYPTSYQPKSTVLEEKKQKVLVCHTSLSHFPYTLIERYSSLRTLTRVTALVRRHVNNRVNSFLFKEILNGPLTPKELKSALHMLIRSIQKVEFSEDIVALSTNKKVKNKSKLKQLNPFLDGDGIIRVGGRLQHADLPEEHKFPIILPHKSHLTWLIIHNCHIDNMHSGFQMTFSTLARDYWIVHGRDTVRNIIRKCVPCRRQRAKVVQQLMGSLPSSRVNITPPFSRCGVDFAGPYTILFNNGRGAKSFKSYFAIFVCLVTKAVHLESVNSLSTESFLGAFKRFAARRGRPFHMFSDCGTNFVGADNELKALVEGNKFNEDIASDLSDDGVTWHFNPPLAPHQGGLWEAGVKSVKFHLRRVVGNCNLTLEEFGTLLCNVEAILNSRPLCAMSPDPEDLSVLTPGHFLIGRPLNAVPDPDLTDVKMNRLSRWEKVQQITQHFWKRWNAEYRSSLQQRFKWTQKRDNVEVNDLVLIHDDLLPPTKWKLARVLQTHPGDDLLVRVVTLKTSSGQLKRPISKLSLILPYNDSNSD